MLSSSNEHSTTNSTIIPQIGPMPAEAGRNRECSRGNKVVKHVARGKKRIKRAANFAKLLAWLDAIKCVSTTFELEGNVTLKKEVWL